jgi:beta-lactamase superfamily II metal-dependent hydrolase
MEDRLLGNEEQLGIRVYNVGLGDCIYVRVPDKNKPGPDKHVHILIDCGNKFGDLDVLQAAIKNIEANLPEDAVSKKKLLDLLVVTHPHEDHHKGFDPAYFENIRIKNLWLSPGFCELDPSIPDRPDKEQELTNRLRALEDAAQNSLNRLVDMLPAGNETKEYLEDLLLSLSKKDAFAVLNGGEKDGKRLDVENRRYVSSNFAYENNTQKDLKTFQEKLAATYNESGPPTWKHFTNDDLNLFHDSKTKIKILGPRSDLNAYMSNPKLKLHFQDSDSAQTEGNDFDQAREQEVAVPNNISIQDFDLLRVGMHSNGLGAAAELGHAVNNLSVVLMLEWDDYRLLFPGDAEWAGSTFEPGKANGSWNVMWEDHKNELKNVDFLKVGHHGSENATPWASKIADKNKEAVLHPISMILNSLLPEERSTAARAVVSTQETKKWPSIPDPILLKAIGSRISNKGPETGQPWRTDRDCKEDEPWLDIFSPEK